MWCSEIWWYTLWEYVTLLLEMAIEIVDLPSYKIVIFQFVMLVYQRMAKFGRPIDRSDRSAKAGLWPCRDDSVNFSVIFIHGRCEGWSNRYHTCSLCLVNLDGGSPQQWSCWVLTTSQSCSKKIQNSHQDRLMTMNQVTRPPKNSHDISMPWKLARLASLLDQGDLHNLRIWPRPSRINPARRGTHGYPSVRASTGKSHGNWM